MYEVLIIFSLVIIVLANIMAIILKFIDGDFMETNRDFINANRNDTTPEKLKKSFFVFFTNISEIFYIGVPSVEYTAQKYTLYNRLTLLGKILYIADIHGVMDEFFNTRIVVPRIIFILKVFIFIPYIQIHLLGLLYRIVFTIHESSTSGTGSSLFLKEDDESSKNKSLNDMYK